MADGKRLVGHAGAVLLRRCADRTGLTDALAKVLPSSTVAGWRDRAAVLVQLAVAIVLGAANLSETEQLQSHHRPLFGLVASDSTARRTLAALDEATLAKIAKVRARVRRHVWSLLRLRPGGFPWLTVAGKRLCGWIVIDLDATVITSASKKTGAAVTFKKTFGFHPLAAWCANTTKSLAMLLRPGNSGANTVADHIRVLTEALAQIPGSSASKILIRVDGAGATHGLLEHLEALNTTRRTVRYTVGWKITDDDEKAIAKLPETAWESSVHQDGSLQEGYFVAELTGVNTREGWPQGMRLIVRRVKPSRRHLKKLNEPGAHASFNTVNWSISNWAMGVTLIGICCSACVQLVTRLRSIAHHRRMHQDLAPLWTALATAYPELVLNQAPTDSKWHRFHRRPTHEQRFYRRLIECRDGLVRLDGVP